MNNVTIREEIEEEVKRILVELSKTNFESRRIKVGVLLGGVLAQIRSYKTESLSDYKINQKLCDCLSCRLGKYDQCQTFNPSKKGKRK